jgi:chromosome segregation ATPase
MVVKILSQGIYMNARMDEILSQYAQRIAQFEEQLDVANLELQRFEKRLQSKRDKSLALAQAIDVLRSAKAEREAELRRAEEAEAEISAALTAVRKAQIAAEQADKQAEQEVSDAAKHAERQAIRRAEQQYGIRSSDPS